MPEGSGRTGQYDVKIKNPIVDKKRISDRIFLLSTDEK